MKKILIANRGEIACRIIDSCKKLKFHSIAVYSDIDKNSKHVRKADESIHIGASKAQESNLNADKIIEAAKKLKAEQRERAAEAYALEMAIHLKRAERERKKKELEAEFAGVFAEVEKKKNELQRLEARISDMEATRKRKDREFSRLQRNLMELLEEQKVELDTLREKGIELETATATSAAAAAATAHAAKENEQRRRSYVDTCSPCSDR